MNMHRKKYCVANWKMNLSHSDIKSFMMEWGNKKINESNVKTIFCPSYTNINITVNLLQNYSSEIGAQNVCYESKGAFTGEVSCAMLKETGCKWVIIGHSERRTIFSETDDVIKKKLEIIISEDLYPILCIGETKEERDTGKTQDVLSRQLSILCKRNNLYELSNLVIAYEPVWAIGSGVTATAEMISIAHKNIRNILNNNGLNGNDISILYGGSVSDNNASELSVINDVDGFLIGGASLNVDKFYSIYNQL